MTKLVVLVLCVCGLPLVMGAPSYDGILEAKRKELKALEQELDELVEKSQKADKYSSNSNEKVGGQSLNGPADFTSYDPVREAPNVVSSGRFVALQSLADSSRRFSCGRSTCSSSGCGHYLLSYDEWKECYNEVYKIYRRDGEGVVRVGDYVALLQYKTNQWLQCLEKSCQLGTCPGSPSNDDGFEDSSKWCDCSEYLFRMSAYNKTIGQVVYPGDVVMIYQPNVKEFLSIRGHTSTCRSSAFPPTLDQYETCSESSFILNY